MNGCPAMTSNEETRKYLTESVEILTPLTFYSMITEEQGSTFLEGNSVLALLMAYEVLWNKWKAYDLERGK